MLPLMLNEHNSILLLPRLYRYFCILYISTKNLLRPIILLLLTTTDIHTLSMKGISLKKMFVDLHQSSLTLLFTLPPHLLQSSHSMHTPRLWCQNLASCTFTIRQCFIFSSLLVKTVQEEDQKGSIGFPLLLGVGLSGNISFRTLPIFQDLELSTEIKCFWFDVDNATTLFLTLLLCLTSEWTLSLPFVDPDHAMDRTTFLFFIFIEQISLQRILSGYAMQ